MNKKKKRINRTTSKQKIYTFFKIQFTNCLLDYKYTIVESLSDIAEYIEQESVKDVLCRPAFNAKVTITGVYMTNKQFTDWHKKHVKP